MFRVRGPETSVAPEAGTGLLPPRSITVGGGAHESVAPEYLAEFFREFHQGALLVWTLEILDEESPASAYLLMERLRHRAGPELAIWPSRVYRALGRLRAWGLLEVVSVPGSPRGRRQYYQITPAGRAAYPAAHEVAERSWRGFSLGTNPRLAGASTRARRSAQDLREGRSPSGTANRRSSANGGGARSRSAPAPDADEPN
jgi:DNA-binding PadR family transcriptional regulator